MSRRQQKGATMRMRVYCKNCDTETNSGTILAINDDGDCELCRAAGTAELVPDYETPKQYEKRTGKKWNGAVWRKHKGASQESTGWIAQSFTGNLEYFYLLCAQSPEPPPGDWKPEEE